jgi:quercetin dioxygenase-like cupin family protein
MVGIVAISEAQQVGAPRTIVQRQDMSVAGHEAIAAIADFQPGTSAGWHTHPGEMVGYVVGGVYG